MHIRIQLSLTYLKSFDYLQKCKIKLSSLRFSVLDFWKWNCYITVLSRSTLNWYCFAYFAFNTTTTWYEVVEAKKITLSHIHTHTHTHRNSRVLLKLFFFSKMALAFEIRSLFDVKECKLEKKLDLILLLPLFLLFFVCLLTSNNQESILQNFFNPLKAKYLLLPV